ncbi:MAG: hypothetical protein P8Y99_18320, partial [Calditrichaceae bacterium]
KEMIVNYLNRLSDFLFFISSECSVSQPVRQSDTLLDIKPYVNEMNGVSDCRTGWLTEHSEEMKNKKSDKRFR